jgi:putative phosphoesterase
MTESLPSQLVVHARIGVIGDIHTDLERLRWALSVLRAQGVERVLATGDLVDGPSDGAQIVRICQLLREVDAWVVLGNHDRWLLDGQQRDLPDATFADDIDAPTREYLQSLPASIEILTPLGLLLFGHGLGSNDMSALHPHDHGPALTNNTTLQTLLRRARYQLVVSGHTHKRMVRKLDAVTFINAGALQLTREPCCLVLDFADHRASFFDYTDAGTKDGPSFQL